MANLHLLKQVRNSATYSKIANLSSLSILLTSSILTICISFSPVASADSLNYPWPTDTEAPCKFAPAGGSSCTNPNDSNDKYDWGVNSGGTFHPYRNGYEYRNCTDYVQWQESQSPINVSVPTNWGNGGQWYDNAPSNEQTTTPKAWDAAVVPGSVGHVAFVQSVNTDGTITVTEYNQQGQGHGGTRTGSASSMGFTKFVDFGVHPSGNGGNGGATTSRPAVLTRSSDSMDVFYRSTSHQLISQGWTAASGWSTTGALPNSTSPVTNVSSNITAVSRTSTSIDLFYRDSSNNLQNMGWTSTGGWSGPWGLVTDGSVNADPVVISTDSNHMDVFYKDSTGKLMDKRWNSTTGWASPLVIISGTSVASSPTAVALDANNFYLFYRDTSNNVLSVGYSSGTWSGPNTRASSISDLTVTSRTSTSLDLFYETTGGGLGVVGYSSGSWSSGSWSGTDVFATTGVSFRGSPLVVKRSSSAMDVFYQDSQNHLVDKGWNSTTGWGAPSNLAGNIYDNPGGTSRSSDSMDLFFRDDTGNLISQGWSAAGGWTQGATGGASMD